VIPPCGKFGRIDVSPIVISLARFPCRAGRKSNVTGKICQHQFATLVAISAGVDFAFNTRELPLTSLGLVHIVRRLFAARKTIRVATSLSGSQKLVLPRSNCAGRVARRAPRWVAVKRHEI
jgi:hypothetical protein